MKTLPKFNNNKKKLLFIQEMIFGMFVYNFLLINIISNQIPIIFFLCTNIFYRSFSSFQAIFSFSVSISIALLIIGLEVHLLFILKVIFIHKNKII